MYIVATFEIIVTTEFCLITVISEKSFFYLYNWMFLFYLWIQNIRFVWSTVIVIYLNFYRTDIVRLSPCIRFKIKWYRRCWAFSKQRLIGFNCPLAIFQRHYCRSFLTYSMTAFLKGNFDTEILPTQYFFFFDSELGSLFYCAAEDIIIIFFFSNMSRIQYIVLRRQRR